MTRTIPIYTDSQGTCQADTCRPLLDSAQSGEIRLEALVHGHYPGRPLGGALPAVKSVGFWDAPHDQSWGLDWHYNEGIELSLLERGLVSFGVEGKFFPLKPDHLTVTRPWQRHRVGSPNVAAGRLHWLILDVGIRRPHQPWRWPSWVVLAKHDIEELTNILRHNEQAVWPASAEVRRCFREIAQAVEADREGTSISLLTILLNKLLLLVLEMFRKQDMTLDHTLSATRRTVELFLADLAGNSAQLTGEWTVRRMAQACGLGVTQFVHYCSEVTNMTPLRYLNHLRLEAAAKTLADQPQLSITEVARMCGFASPQYFATTFGHRFRCSPREYRGKPRG